MQVFCIHCFLPEYGQNGESQNGDMPKRRQKLVELCEAFKQLFRALIVSVLNISFLLRDAMLARYMLLCVCVCLSHSGIVSKRLNIGLRKQSRTITHRLEFADAKDHGEISNSLKHLAVLCSLSPFDHPSLSSFCYIFLLSCAVWDCRRFLTLLPTCTYLLTDQCLFCDDSLGRITSKTATNQNDPLQCPTSKHVIHCVSKNDSDVSHYNFNPHQPIFIIFGTYVAEWVRYRMVICYLTSPD